MYGDGGLSDVIATDSNSLLHSSTFKYPSDGEVPMMNDLVSSDSYEHNHNHDRNQNNIQNDNRRSDIGGQTESSLMRYGSAPSSFYSNLLEENECDDLLVREFFSRYHEQQQKLQPDSCEVIRSSSSTSMKLERKNSGIPKIDFSTVLTGTYGGSSQQMPRFRPGNGGGLYDHTNHNNLDSSSTFRSMNLIRQSSSPAGFLSSLNSETGMRDVEKTISPTRLNNISFTPGISSSSMVLPQIPENRNQVKDSTFKSLKRTRDNDTITLDKQDGLSGRYTPSLVHHLSLPKTSSEIAVAEKLLRFGHDLVPSQSRAKRGCATHPRSIAERVRRTRISARMKKLQELFPNMDKQTSIADMLDMAVQYIKNLQKDLQTLKDARSRCACSSKQ